MPSNTINPIAASAIYGIASCGDKLWAIDSRNGYLLEIDPITHNSVILNSKNTEDFIGVTGIAIGEPSSGVSADNTLWFTNNENVYFCSLEDYSFTPQLFTRLDYPANGIAIWNSTVYITCQKTGEILIYNRNTKKQITHFYAPGIGIENIAVQEETIWLTDTLEQTVYCLERATGEVIFNVLTPFDSPTGLTFHLNRETNEEILYVSYADQEAYIRDNPNANPNHELQYLECQCGV